MTIQNHTSHAANERTFLAWVRTSLAVIGFGFLVERFDLFVVGVMPKSEHIAGARSEFGHVAGLTLIVLGMAMIGVAARRFARRDRCGMRRPAWNTCANRNQARNARSFALRFPRASRALSACAAKV